MAPIELSPRQRAFLKSKGHALEPKLQIGKSGLSDAFLRELEIALSRDELVKVRVGKQVEDALAEEAAARTSAALVATLGRTVLYYRAAEEPVIELPS
ncbi:YhbY family RNA-binding protein [bacterium]|nr:YhbY family RNA-binding protein [bacterium]